MIRENGRSSLPRLAVGLLLVGLVPIAAASEGPPEVLLGEPIARKLVLVERHPMTVRAYEPPYELRPAQSRAAASATSPEKALEGWLGAILSRDREWLLQSFDEGSRARIVAADKKVEDKFFAYFFDGRRVVLQHRVEVAGRLLIELAIFDRESGTQMFRQLLELRKTGERWLLADLPKEKMFTELAANFDAASPRLEIDLGDAMLTSRP